jgi:hypothetical protein
MASASTFARTQLTQALLALAGPEPLAARWGSLALALHQLRPVDLPVGLRPGFLALRAQVDEAGARPSDASCQAVATALLALLLRLPHAPRDAPRR